MGERTALVQAGLGLAMLGLLAGCGWFGSGEPQEGVQTGDAPETVRTLRRAETVYAIYELDPMAGPLAGNTAVRLRGAFPRIVLADQAYAGDAVYRIYFGEQIATLNPDYDPAWSASLVDVLTPPADTTGTVDVILRDIQTLRDAAAIYEGYEYRENAQATP